MNIEEGLRRKTGGQWLVNPVGKETVFCREMFTDEHKEVKKMIEQFSQEKIYPKIKDLDSLNENLSRTILQEMGELGLIGVDTPEEYGGIELDKIRSEQNFIDVIRDVTAGKVCALVYEVIGNDTPQKSLGIRKPMGDQWEYVRPMATF